MATKRSIQDIVPPARSKPIRADRAPKKEIVKEELHTPPPKKPRSQKRATRNSGKGFGFIGVILVVLIIIGLAFGVVSTVFHRADIVIVIKDFSVPIDATFEAAPDGVSLSFTSKTFEETAIRVVSRSGIEEVEERASGKITVFNAYSKSGQRLIANTRFESPEGKIYRISGPIVVPGYTTGSGGKVVPGELEVTVYADEAGEEYNTGPTEFTIPGLKGTAQFEKMYARSEASLSGGFVGEKAVVSPEIRDAALSDLQAELDRAIRANISTNLKENELFFPDTVTVRFIEQPDQATSEGAIVSVVAEATVPVFDERKLASVISNEGSVLYGGALRIQNADTLSIATESSEIEGNIRLSIAGVAELVAAYDTAQLREDLAGTDRREVGSVLSQYPAISDMSISVYPFWRGQLPDDSGRLLLEETSGEISQ